VKLVSTTATGLLLALPDDTSTGGRWKLGPYDESVLELRAEPEFVPVSPGSTQGARVWRFDVLGAGSTDLQASYVDTSGNTSSYFFVTISVQELVATPF